MYQLRSYWFMVLSYKDLFSDTPFLTLLLPTSSLRLSFSFDSFLRPFFWYTKEQKKKEEEKRGGEEGIVLRYKTFMSKDFENRHWMGVFINCYTHFWHWLRIQTESGQYMCIFMSWFYIFTCKYIICISLYLR